MKLAKFIGIKIVHRNGCLKMELVIWMFIALGILILSVIVLSRGVSERVNKPNEQLKEQITELENRVKSLEEKL